MNHEERQHLAGVATERVVGLFRTAPGAFYQESVQHKLILLLQAVDRVALSTEKPLLFSEIVPGFDLVILRNPDRPLPVPANPDPLDPRALSSVDESCLALVAQAVDHYLAEQQATGDAEQAGAYTYVSQDGFYYFGFRSLYRASVLKEMDVSDDGLINVADFIGGGEGKGRVLQ